MVVKLHKGAQWPL